MNKPFVLHNRNVAFIYWGRRGFSRFVLEAAHTARDIGLNAFFSVSTNNELYPSFRELGDKIFAVNTFDGVSSALLNTLRVRQLRNGVIRWLDDCNIDQVVVLMPHIWTPLIASGIKRHGISYSVVLHDAKPHPGDHTGAIFYWLLQDVKSADTVIALSDWVRSELIRRKVVPAERVRTLFLPDVIYPSSLANSVLPRTRNRRYPLRILFLGRLLQYKALPTFLEAVELLVNEQVPIEVSVCGEGDLREVLPKLQQLNVTLINRWLTDEEIGTLLGTHDAVVLTHFEASQSGVISAALGAGIPVITTPAGGLADQVLSRGAGLVCEGFDASAVARQIRLLALDHSLYNRLVAKIHTNNTSTMARFLDQLTRIRNFTPAK